MLGAVIGSIVGSTYETHHTNDYYFDLFPEGSRITDDTVCTVAVAEALINEKPIGKTIHEWGRKYVKLGYLKGVSGNFAKWLANDKPTPYGSYGSGSAMRVSAIGMWHRADPFRCMETAIESALCTHNSTEGVMGAICVAESVRQAMMRDAFTHTPREGDFLSASESNDQIIPFKGGSDPDQTIPFKGGSGPAESQPSHFCSRLLEHYYPDVDCDHTKHTNAFETRSRDTVPFALDIVRRSNSFEDAIRRAVTMGGDADTLAAIVGGIAEQMWEIPQEMEDKAMTIVPSQMRNTIERFYYSLGQKGHSLLGRRKHYLPGESVPKKATGDMWDLQELDESKSKTIKVNFWISGRHMERLRMGLAPGTMDGGWLMYCTENEIHWCRAWTPIAKTVFVAKYKHLHGNYNIYELRANCEMVPWMHFEERAKDSFRRLINYDYHK